MANSSDLVYNMKYLRSSGYRALGYFRSYPPLNILESERVTSAVGPLLASTRSSSEWIFLVSKTVGFLLSSM